MSGEEAVTAVAQELVGFMSNDEWDGLLGEVNGLVEQMEALPDGDAKAQMFRLLDGIDAIHREALHRLVRLFKEGVLEKVVTDPAIHTLMELYDLLPASSEAAANTPTTPTKSRFPTIPIRAIASVPSAPPRHPHWVPILGNLADLKPETPVEMLAADGPVLLCRRGDEVFALAPICARDGSSLLGATLSGYTLTCPAHAGCHYDIRQGVPVGGGEAIDCLPVRVEVGGRIMIGLDMDFTPHLPAF